MERRDEQAPFPREPWQRLLGDDADGPPETTDARIRAAARRDLAPRGRRWWLPASLAASFVLAVLIVRSEFGTIERPARLESDVAGDSAIDARLIERGAGPEAREAGESPSAPAPRARAQKSAPADEYGEAVAITGSEDAGAGPRVGGPEHDARFASEPPDEASSAAEARYDVESPPAAAAEAAAPAAGEALGNVTVSGARREADAAAPLPQITASKTSKADAPVPPSPETWYAEIRKMFAEGRRAEAERELEALRKAYPDWAAQNVKAEELR